MTRRRSPPCSAHGDPVRAGLPGRPLPAAARGGGTFGAVAFALNFLGLALFGGIAYTRNFVLVNLDEPTIDRLLETPTLAAFVVTAVFGLVGGLLAAAAMVRAAVVPRTAAALYAAGFTVLCPTFVLPVPVVRLGHLVAGAGIVWPSRTVRTPSASEAPRLATRRRQVAVRPLRLSPRPMANVGPPRVPQDGAGHAAPVSWAVGVRARPVEELPAGGRSRPRPSAGAGCGQGGGLVVPSADVPGQTGRARAGFPEGWDDRSGGAVR